MNIITNLPRSEAEPVFAAVGAEAYGCKVGDQVEVHGPDGVYFHTFVAPAPTEVNEESDNG